MSEERRYGTWVGNPKGTPEDPTRCIKSVSEPPWYIRSHQCQNKRGKGKGGKYCGIHAKQHPEE